MAKYLPLELAEFGLVPGILVKVEEGDAHCSMYNKNTFE